MDCSFGLEAEKHLRKDETISVDPIRVLGVECHELVEEDVCNRSHTHGSARVARVGFGGGIDLERL